mgnify:CR=1 FL=1
MLVRIMLVAASCVSLPYFDKCVGNWFLIVIQHLSTHDYPLANWFSFMLPCEVCTMLKLLFLERRPGYFRQCMWQMNQRLRGGAFNDPPSIVRSATRLGNDPVARTRDGFRLALRFFPPLRMTWINFRMT